jgi:hypothetical protein
MFDDQFTPDERALIERLASAPQPNLKPAALNTIRQQMFDALDAPPAPPSAPSSLTPLGGMFPTVIVIVVIVASIIGVIFFTRNTPSESSLETATPFPTVAPTEATVPALVSTSEVTAEASAEIAPEVTATPIPESTLQAEVTIEPLDTAIVIEGPVEAINGNIVTIYGIDIELAPDDALLLVIQVGDVIRVEGNPKGGDTVIVVAVNVLFINVDVVIQDGQVWRDDGNCNNPPPPWAPAHGWRRRCESQGGGGGRGGGEGSRS